MKSFIAAALLSVVTASPILEDRQSGAGPFGVAQSTTDSGLANHAIYLPTSTSTTGGKWPVVVWGNGGCGGDGNSNSKFLGWLASYGYLAIASGRPGGSGSTTAQMMTQSIDFAVKVAGTGRYANVDASKIFASGFSCGGVEAMAQSWDKRVSTIGVISSGLLTNYSAASTFTKPILYAIGGSGDVAYQNAERDFKALPANTPAWKGNLNLGHGGDLFGNNGGKFGKVQLHWLEWLFKGNEESAKYFTEGYKADGWQVQTRAMDKLKPFV
ncbi:Alpha/Beta hydrolase protein [Podospora aff. communis PSN243]|uniref:Alpha/Beta hydrolase protein n=1 Tax=Podospora aff. communis PSN243 TaxID=3040156 RepID=A0AAV9GCE7_9PEZI|nr:Alpha/Beta hydrolase protein [Podospora aff. communis PSN243]